MHLTIKERVELVLMSGADGTTNRSVAKKFNRIYLAKKFCFNKNVCYYYLNCFICFGALFMAQNVCYYYRNCFICFGALFMAHPVFNFALNPDLPTFKCRSVSYTDTNILAFTNISNGLYHLCLLSQ